MSELECMAILICVSLFFGFLHYAQYLQLVAAREALRKCGEAKASLRAKIKS